MKEVYINPDSAQVGLFKSFLDEAGIASFVRNETSSNVIMGAPVFYPTLCVLSDGDYERAKAILAEHQQAVSSQGGEWICPNCQSIVPAGFETCWNCERERPQV